MTFNQIRFVICGAVILSFLVMLIINLVLVDKQSVKRAGFVFWLIAAGFLHSMAVKPPSVQITWGDGLHDNGTHFDTNTWRTIYFKWTKDNRIADSTEVYFAAKRAGVPDIDWDEIGMAHAGNREFNYTFEGNENATNYLYYAFTGVAPVHTNGTWTARILKRADGGAGVDKLLIIEGKIEENGKQVAPFKEK